MQSNYSFLTDHSYSIPLKQLKKVRQISKKLIDRNSSDKENNSTVSMKKTITKSRTQRKNKIPSKIIIKSTKKLDKNDITQPSLSIEERVKLRRTKPLIITPINKKKSHLKKTIIKSKKFFLGSGLDLDNIVLGNRQRRSVQT